METILLFLPMFFIFFTGILIAWSAYLIAVMSCLAEKNIGRDKKTIKTMCLYVIAGFALFLLGNLFIFTSFAAFHMPTILFLEIWYVTFLYRITDSPWNTPCHQLVDKLTIFKNRKIPQ